MCVTYSAKYSKQDYVKQMVGASMKSVGDIFVRKAIR